MASEDGKSATLNDVVDHKESYALNQDPAHPFENVFRGAETLYFKSDCDAEVIACIKFRSQVNLRTLVLRSKAAETAPTVCKLYVNRTGLDFGDVGSVDATQSFDLTKYDLAKGASLNVTIHKFQRIATLHLYLNNSDAEHLVLGAMTLLGTSSELGATDLSELRKKAQEDE